MTFFSLSVCRVIRNAFETLSVETALWLRCRRWPWWQRSLWRSVPGNRRLPRSLPPAKRQIRRRRGRGTRTTVGRCRRICSCPECRSCPATACTCGRRWLPSAEDLELCLATTKHAAAITVTHVLQGRRTTMATLTTRQLLNDVIFFSPVY